MLEVCSMDFTDVTPNLIVADIDRSIASYRDVLGFSMVAHVPDAAPFVFACYVIFFAQRVG